MNLKFTCKYTKAVGYFRPDGKYDKARNADFWTSFRKLLQNRYSNV